MNATSEPACNKFIVLGFPRSGTTLLRRLLDAHPAISCPPETGLVSACGRFLQTSPTVDGLSVGVIPGLAFSGVAEDDVLNHLRTMMFDIHARIAGDKPVWVEKSGFDIFYLDAIERLFASHCKFICLIRHPLDVIASVKDLCDGMDQILPELHRYVRQHASVFDAFAEAWLDCTVALDAFRQRHAERCFFYRYEDMVQDPRAVLTKLLDFMGVEDHAEALLTAAFKAETKVGLGDWRTYETRGVTADSLERWRTKLPASTVSRVVPVLSETMLAHGYELPKTKSVPDLKKAVRHFQFSKQLLQRSQDSA